MKVETKLWPLELQVCTSNPMMLKQYQRVKMQAAIFVVSCFIYNPNSANLRKISIFAQYVLSGYFFDEIKNPVYMKQFFKMTLATLVGLLLFSFVSMFLTMAVVSAFATLGEKTPVMPSEAMLTIDFSTISLTEQTQEANTMAGLSGETVIQPLGIFSAIRAINAAAQDPAIKFIFMKPDKVSGGIAQIEEFRTALEHFRYSGKPIISYIENPGNGSIYLASVSDKVYMTSNEGAMSMFNGLSSQMIFLKDALDRLGVNVQLIRHGKYKSAGEMYIRSSSSKENLEQNQAMIDAIWDNWAEKISASRGVDTEKLDEMINDLDLNFSEDFLSSGLVDGLVTFEELKQVLCDQFVAPDYSSVKSISLEDYALLKNTVNFKAMNKVAIIYAEGSIVDGKEKKEVAGDRFAKIISDVRKDASVKAVVLRVNSPGGSVLASDKIRSELELLRKDKPLIASYGDYAASGGYWISAGCDEIFSNPSTLTGSIGVFSMIPDLSKTLKNVVKVNVTPVNSHNHSDLYNMTRPLSDKEVAYMQASVERIYESFTTLVAEGRDMDVKDVDAIAQGRVWAGSDALKIGLVDTIGTIEDATLAAAMRIDGVTSLDDVQIIEYPKPLTQFELILEAITGEESVFAGTPLESVENAFRGWTQAESGKVYAAMPYVYDIR